MRGKNAIEHHVKLSPNKIEWHGINIAPLKSIKETRLNQMLYYSMERKCAKVYKVSNFQISNTMRRHKDDELHSCMT